MSVDLGNRVDVAPAVREVTAPRREPILKRPFDILLSTIGIVGSTPLWVAAALAIKLDDGGPVFYLQERVGLHGRTFKARKFRSMAVDADQRFGARAAVEGDARITRVGRFMRSTAMDELPQLWNIARGDMSFVGPRALLPGEVEVNSAGGSVPLNEIDGFQLRHSVRPGLTGLAQVYASRDLPRRNKFKLDILYIRRQSFWLDLRLIVLSFWITFRGKWEHRGKKVSR